LPRSLQDGPHYLAITDRGVNHPLWFEITTNLGFLESECFRKESSGKGLRTLPTKRGEHEQLRAADFR